MNASEVRTVILDYLRLNSAATDFELIDLIGGDQNLYQRIRARLILEDLAEDKNGVGLIYKTPSSSSLQDLKTKTPDISSQLLSGVDIGSFTDIKIHRIFISYGRKDAEKLAFRLEKDLAQKGYCVWLDKKQIKPGKSWEEQIEKAILEHETFIALLTPHAVRRPDGVCLDEISMARYNSRKIIPTMVIMCRPPLGIYRLDWVDFTDWKNPVRYKQGLDRLIDAIEAPTQVEGTHARIFSSLSPLDFGAEISKHTRDFTGRQWLFDKLEEWLFNEKSRVFFITGDPGTGKSAIMAYLVHKNPYVSAYHFCVSSLVDSLDPFRFVRSIAAQLATQIDSYRIALNDIALEEITESDPGSLLRRLVADPLKATLPATPLLLLIDALDEGFLMGGRNIPQILSERLYDLPPCMRIVVSSRKEPEILDMFSHYKQHEIDVACKENLKDMSAFLNKKFQSVRIADILLHSGANQKDTVELVSNRGRGNFLYVTQTIAGIEAGRIDPKRAETFPDGLIGIYQNYFERVFPRGEGFEESMPLLNVILSAREPLTIKQIALFTNRDSFDVKKQLEKVAVFFPEENGLYQVYHKSLGDWLSGLVGRSMTYRVNLKKGHTCIAERLLSNYQDGQVDRFTLARLPAHLIGAGRWEALVKILTDLRFIEAKCAAGMTYELIADYTTTLDVLPEARRERVKELEHEVKIRRYIDNLIAFSKGEVKGLDIIHSIKPWNEENFREETKRIISNPNRLDRIRSFYQFINAEAHILVKFAAMPGFTIQHALNWANSGPVADSAKTIVSSEVYDALLLRSRAQCPSSKPHSAQLRTLEGHKNAVKSVCVTPDGRRAVSGSYDKTCRVWNLYTGECFNILKGHTNLVSSVCMTPDGRMAISGSSDNTLRMWDLDTGECMKKFKDHQNAVRSADVTPNGQRAVSGSDDRTCRVWDLDTGECMKKLEGHLDAIHSISVTPDGRLAVSGSFDKTCRVWDLDTGKCLKVVEVHTDVVNSICVTPDGRLAVSGSFDKTCRVWDLDIRKCLKTLEGHTNAVYNISMTPDGQKAISGSFDNTLRVWNIQTGECLNVLEGHTDAVNNVSVTTDGLQAVSGSYDNTLRVWDLETGKCLNVLGGHTDAVSKVNLTPDRRRAVSVSRDKTCRVWDIQTGKCLSIFEGHTDWVSSVCVTPDGRRAVSGSDDKTCRVWDIQTGKCLSVLEGYTARVLSISLTPDSRLAVSGNEYKTFRVWDLDTGKCLNIFGGHTDWVSNVSVTPDGRRVVSVSRDRTCRVWDLQSGKCLNIFEGHTDWVSSVSVTPDGRWAFSGSDDKTCRVWDLDTDKCMAIYVHNGVVLSLSTENAYLNFVCATQLGDVACLTAHNFPPATPIVTPVIFWLFGDDINKGCWEEVVVSTCKWCGQRFPVSDRILDTIAEINRKANLSPEQSPCIELPDEAWKEPKLLSECSGCNKPLRFNPFIVDDRGRY